MRYSNQRQNLRFWAKSIWRLSYSTDQFDFSSLKHRVELGIISIPIYAGPMPSLIDSCTLQIVPVSSSPCADEVVSDSCGYNNGQCAIVWCRSRMRSFPYILRKTPKFHLVLPFSPLNAMHTQFSQVKRRFAHFHFWYADKITVSALYNADLGCVYFRTIEKQPPTHPPQSHTSHPSLIFSSINTPPPTHSTQSHRSHRSQFSQVYKD